MSNLQHSNECLAFRARAKEYAREMAMTVDANELIEMMNSCLDDCPLCPRKLCALHKREHCAFCAP